MSRGDAWASMATPDRIRLPSNIEELGIICSETAVRTVSHIGIELLNCVFNSPELQRIRQRLPSGQPVQVKLRFNAALMDRIHVFDPIDGSHVEVLNADPITRDLSAKQVAALEAQVREARADQKKITRAQARQRIVELCAPLINRRNRAANARALKILGVYLDAPGESTKPARKARKPKAVPSAAEPNQDHQLPAQAEAADTTPQTVPPVSAIPQFATRDLSLTREAAT